MNLLKRLLANHLDFVLLSAFMAAVQAPFFRGDVWPHHDTFEAFNSFYLFYNGFVGNGQWPFWVPYGFYGLPSHVFQNILTPASYFILFIGKIFHIPNALFMFKASIILEQWILLLGAYRLAGLLFERKATRIFVCAGILLSVVWQNQLVLNFRIYYLLPLGLYYLILFFKEKRPHHFWIACTLFAVPLMGTAAYYLPLYAVLIFFFSLPFFPFLVSYLKLLFSLSLKNICFLVLFLAVSLFLIYFVTSSFRGLSNYSSGRDPKTRSVTLETFLHYGGHTAPDKYLGLLHAGPVVRERKFGITGGSMGDTVDFTLYLGFLPLLFLRYAFLRKQNRIFWGFVSASLFIFFFSLGDPYAVARFIYSLFPPIRLFRHIGLTAGLLKFFVMILAGFGLDHFLKDIQQKQKRSALIDFGVSGALFAGAFLFSQFMFNGSGQFYPKTWPSFDAAMCVLFVVCILSMTLSAVYWTRLTGALAVFFVCLNLLGYQERVFVSIAKWPNIDQSAGNTQLYSYKSVRSNNMPHDKRGKTTWKLVFTTTRYTIAYNFMDLDRCFSSYRTDFLTEGVDRLYRVRGGSPPEQVPFKDGWFNHVVGCESPKLRLSRNVFYFDALEEGELAARQLNKESKTAFLRQIPLSQQIRSDEQELPQNVEVLSYTPNELRANVIVEGKEPAWLIYADAYFPGWKAYVDGLETPVREADFAFKALRVEPGSHEIHFVFKSAAAVLQMIACVLGVILLGFSIYDFKNI